jgi:hypothetical protein
VIAYVPERLIVQQHLHLRGGRCSDVNLLQREEARQEIGQRHFLIDSGWNRDSDDLIQGSDKGQAFDFLQEHAQKVRIQDDQRRQGTALPAACSVSRAIASVSSGPSWA